jgi:hypothetical protein
VHDLAVQPREGDVVVATHGRSVYVADAAPLRTLSEEVRKEDLHAFPVKNATWSRTRGYGEHPYLTWDRRPPVVRLSWWAGAPGTGPAKIAIRDSYGSVWKEIAAQSRAGMNVHEYDLSADPSRVKPGEAERQKRLEEKDRAKTELDKKLDRSAEPKEDAEEDEDEADGGAAGASTGEKPVPADLRAVLADPLRERRTAYLPAGTFTVEISAGRISAKTKLTVKPPKKEAEASDDDAPGLEAR